MDGYGAVQRNGRNEEKVGDMKKISLFTPCYNEEGNIEDLYNVITETMKKIPQYDYEYVIIDNCSTDDTPNILRKIAKKDKRVKVIFNLKNFGPSRSGSYGFFQTSGDCSICLAADFQDPPEMIPEFIKEWEAGSKVVWGKKKSSDEKKAMFNIRRAYYKIIKSISDNEQYEDVTGYRWECWHFRYIGKPACEFQKKYFNDIQQFMLEFIDSWKKTSI